MFLAGKMQRGYYKQTFITLLNIMLFINLKHTKIPLSSRRNEIFRVRFFASAIILFFVSGCATFNKDESLVYRHYKGAIRPNIDIAIVKSITVAESEKLPSNMLAVELSQIDKVEFNQKGGLGGGQYEIHFWPGEYRLRLRLPESTAEDIKNLDAREVEFPLSAEKGHRYILGGELFKDSKTGKQQWRPVMFDQTRVIGWQRRTNDGKESSKETLRSQPSEPDGE